MSEQGHYGLLVIFPDESPSFVNGFEAGQIWQQMQASTPTIDKTVHSETREVLNRMAVNQGYEAEFSSTPYKEWLNFVARKTKPIPERSNPNGIRIVK